ncbi:MAG: NYN domain-containing protein, partial [Gemmatimonadales bacterium]
MARKEPRPTHAPNAALLIDFDNVTLGIRSDLTKELKSLLGSDIIKGKVAVQRAYADWRRYPQYIVPLSESSIDLIFAPAFGTNKKNATDIRLAIDAIELVFTRPEIGTFILLSGDSDFSTMVIKLKEYGKYVIGVGLRESASDLLIQNCDEYYSYSDLAGLSREEDRPSAQRDPWELVTEAVTLMVRRDDVMRSDRLKQVMQQIDPNFDEHNAGFSRFSKFIVEAGNRGLVQVTKMENGQYEIAPVAGGTGAGVVDAPKPPPKPAPKPAEGRAEPAGARRGRRGRGRGRDREREKTS